MDLEELARRVAQAPVLRRAPALRGEIVGALERAERLEKAARAAVEMHGTRWPDDPDVHQAMWSLGDVLAEAEAPEGGS